MSEAIITKKAIAQGFKKLILKKDFHKISIHDITNECGLNRQTFYYHFQDKYDLLNWIYYQEAFIVVIDNLTFDNYHTQFQKLFQIMYEDKKFYQNTIRCDQNYFYNYLVKLTTKIFHDAIHQLDEMHQLDEKDKLFYAKFYAYAFSGSIIDWVLNDMKQSPKTLSQQLKRFIEDTEKLSYQHYLNDKQNQE